MDKPLFLIAENYPGIWMEHLYDSILYAQMYPEKREIAVNVIKAFLQHQKEDGQFPCYIWDGNRLDIPKDKLIGYGQIQEVVSYARLTLDFYRQTNDKKLLRKCYESAQKWDLWLRKNRMTLNRGLIEQFVGFDTGHDNSARNEGLAHLGEHRKNGEVLNAAVLPDDDGITPILAVDMNCNFYSTQKALAEMALIFGEKEKAEHYLNNAKNIKAKLFEYCFDKEDAYFYDVDRNGNKRKCKSSTIFHLFLERVLDKEEDKVLIEEIYKRHIKNPEEFWTPYPFPSMAVNDPSWSSHKKPNSWGYYSQANIALRTTLWMDYYGWSDDLDVICEKWLTHWVNCFGERNFAQEIDPITGQVSSCSQWYSACMLFCLYSAKRLRYIE